MGFLKKLIKAPIKLHKKVLKTGVKIAKKTTPGMGGGGKGKHLQAARRNASGAGARAGTRGGATRNPTASPTQRVAGTVRKQAPSNPRARPALPGNRARIAMPGGTTRGNVGSRIGSTVQTKPARAAVMPSKAAPAAPKPSARTTPTRRNISRR